MKIANNQYNNYHTSFKAIKLSEKELLESKKLLNQYIKAPNSELESLKNKTFKFFEKHLHGEIDLKTKGYHIKEDFSQEFFLEFFVLLEDIRKKTLPIEDFISKLNKIKPTKTIIKSGILEKSIDETIGDTSLKISNLLTEANLPVYASSKNEEENEENISRLNEIIKKTNLSDREIKVVSGYGNGKKNKDISKELELSAGIISQIKKKGVLKIQQAFDILPDSVRKIAEELKEKYNLDLTVEEIMNSLILNPYVFEVEKDLLYERISKFSKMVKLKEKIWANVAVKNSSLLSCEPEVLYERLKQNSKNLNISKDSFMKAVLKFPLLLRQLPESLYDKIEQISKLFNINKKAYIKASLRQPVLLALTPKTLQNNIEQNAKNLNISNQKFMKCALIQPSLFYLDPKALYERIQASSKIFNIDIEDFIKLALQQPALFEQKPETLYKNISESARLLGVDVREIINLARRRPAVFSSKPETIVNKIKLAKYTKQVKNQESSTLSVFNNSKELSYKLITTYLVQKYLKLKKLHHNDLYAILKSHPDLNYKFELPESEFNEEFMEFTRNLFKETLGKSNVEFTIKNKS